MNKTIGFTIIAARLVYLAAIMVGVDPVLLDYLATAIKALQAVRVIAKGAKRIRTIWKRRSDK